MEFKQIDTNFDRFIFIIEDTGLRLIKKKINSSTNTFVDFEDIGSKIIIENTRKPVWLIISFVLLTAAITVFVKRLNGGAVGNGVEIFLLTMSLISFLVFLITKRNIIFLLQSDNTNAIEFIGTKRYKQKVDDFINVLLQKRDAYLVQKYSTLNEFLPYDQQYNNLVWLYNLKLLTKEELQNKLDELDNIEFNNENARKNESINIVGFKTKKSNNNENEEQNAGR